MRILVPARRRKVVLTAACGLLLTLAGCVSHTGAGDQTRSITIRHYFEGPAETLLYRLSPDGQKLASLERQGRAINLVVEELESGERHQATRFKGGAVAAFAWANNSRLVFYSVDVRDLVAVDFDGGNQRRLNPDAELLRLIHRLPGEQERMLAARYQPRSDTTELVSMDVYTGRSMRLARGPDQWPARWFLDPDGQVMAAELAIGEEKSILRRDPDSGTWIEILRQPKWDPSIRLLDAPVRDGRGLALVATSGRAGQLSEFDFTSGKAESNLAEVSARGCCVLLAVPGNGRTLAAYERRQVLVTHYLDDDLQAESARLGATHQGRQIGFTQLSDNGGRGLYVATSVLLDPDFYLLDFHSATERLLDKSPEALPLLSEYRASLSRSITVTGNSVPSFALQSTTWTRLSNQQVDASAQRSVTTGARPQK